MGTLILAASSTAPKSNPAFTFIILAALIGLFYVLIMRPQRNRQRKAMQTQNQIVPGQKIRTTAGMYGTVVSGDDRDVVIEIAPGVEVTMLRRAIMDVVPDDTMPSHEDIPEPEYGAADEAGEHEAEAEPEQPADEFALTDEDVSPDGLDMRKDRNA